MGARKEARRISIALTIAELGISKNEAARQHSRSATVSKEDVPVVIWVLRSVSCPKPGPLS